MQRRAPGAVADGRRDFDFLFGRWHVRNRRLARPFDRSCTEWVEFDAASYVRPILGGLGNIDFLSAVLPDGQPYEGMALRLFEPATGLWRIWWTSTARAGVMDAPVKGRFSDGQGRFIGDDHIDGRPVKVEFRWTAVSPASARWQQALSYDGGESWDSPNWTMTFTRVAHTALGLSSYSGSSWPLNG